MMVKEFKEVKAWCQHILGLHLVRGWRVSRVGLTATEEYEVHVECSSKAAQACPKCGKKCPGYDRRERRWRSMDVGGTATHVVCRVPRVKCPEHGVQQIDVPWAERGSRYTAAFESHVIGLLQDLPRTRVARRTGLGKAAVTGIMKRATGRGLARRRLWHLAHLAVDEVSYKRRHHYLTIVSDRMTGLVVYVGYGRQKEALAAFYRSLGAERLAAIQSVTMDMWQAYIAATEEWVPDAQKKICFDHFHVSKKILNALRLVLRDEDRELREAGDKSLVGTRYQWMMNPQNMSRAQRRKFFELARRRDLRAARAWAMKEEAARIWRYVRRSWVLKLWMNWLAWAQRCRLRPMVKAGQMVRKHLYGILNAITMSASNAGAEALNSRIRMVKNRSCGFRNIESFRDAVYFHFGGLDLCPRPIRANG